MRIIGLCGRSGSGKGTFANVAETNGFYLIDCDKIYREMVSKPSECLTEIGKYFGEELIKEGSLDRKTLASIVFSDKEKLNILNRITHKHIIKRVREIIFENNNEQYILIDAPTLFESGANEICDTIVGIVAKDSDCIIRIVDRDSINEPQASLRLSNQLGNDFIIENSDFIIYNESSLEEFEKASKEVIELIKGCD